MKKITAFSALIALSLTACQPAADDGKDSIKIGLITPLTGEVAALGMDILHGTQLKLKEINEAGGIDGRMVELIAEDGKCTGSDAASAAQKLIHIDKVVAIEGAGCSGETLAAAPIAEEAKIILISPSSTSPDITDAGDFVFRTNPNDDLKTTAMANYFKENDLGKVAIISENTDFAVAFHDSLEGKIGEDAFVFDEVVEPGTKDYRTLMTRLSDVDFDVFVVNANLPPSAAIMVQQLREQGLEQLAIGQDVSDATEVIKLAGEASEGLQVINVPTIGHNTKFGQKFLAEYGEPSANMSWGAYGYDTLGVLLQAIAKVGTDSEAIRDYFYDLDGYRGVVGTFAFDENGDVTGIRYALKEVQNGEFVKIEDIDVN